MVTYLLVQMCTFLEGTYNSSGLAMETFFLCLLKKNRTEQMLCKISFLQNLFSLIEYIFHEGGDFPLFCSLIYSKHLEEHQAPERYSVNIWSMYEWFLNVRLCCLNDENTFYRPQTVKKISIYASLYIANFTQILDLPPKETWREDSSWIPALPLNIFRPPLQDFKLGSRKQFP